MTNIDAGSVSIYRPRIMAVLFAGLFIVFTAILSLIPMLPAVSAELNVSKPMLGIIMGAFMVFMAFPQIPIGVLSDRYGRRPFIFAGFSVFSFGLLVFGYATSGYQLLIARAMSGLGAAMFFPTAYTIVGDIYALRERGKGMGLVSMAVGLGTVGGYVLGGVIGGLYGWRTVFLSMFWVSLLVAVSAILIPETSPKCRDVDFGIRKMVTSTLGMFRDRTVLLAGIISMLCAVAVIGANFTLSFFASNTISPVKMGFIFIPYAITSSLGASVTGYLSDRVGRKNPLIVMIISGGVALMLLSHFELTELWLAINFGFVGLCLGPVVTLSTAILSDRVIKSDSRVLGTSIGAFNMVRWLGAAAGPVVAGSMMDFAGARAGFLLLAILILCAAVISLFLQETLE